MIQAEQLVTILWLSNPYSLSREIAVDGLTKLVSTTIRNDMPSPALFSEFDRNVTKYAKGKLDNADLVHVAHSNACKSESSLRRINKLADQSPEAFQSELKRIADAVESDRASKEKEHERKVKELSERARSSDEKLEGLRVQVRIEDEEHRKVVKKLSEDVKSTTNELDMLRTAANAELLQEIEQQLENAEEAYSTLSTIKQSIVKDARKRNRRHVKLTIAVMILPLAFGFIYALFKGWDKVEGFVTLWLSLPFIISAGYFWIKEKSLKPKIIIKNHYMHIEQKIIKKREFNESQYVSLQGKIEKLRNRVSYFNIGTEQLYQHQPATGLSDPTK